MLPTKAMESTDKTGAPPKSEALPPPSSTAPFRVHCFVSDVVLRVLLFVASVVAVVVMVTSKQTVAVAVPGAPPGRRISLTAKFNQSPAYIYFVAALLVAGLYSIVTTLASLSVIWKPAFSKQFLLYFALWDVLMLGVVASATGTAGGVAYVGLKGNKHVGWGKVCNVYDKFCDRVVSSIAMSLLASILLVLLSMLSVFSLYKPIRD